LGLLKNYNKNQGNKMKKRNERHPEKRHCETFLRNATKTQFNSEIHFQTKRMGCRAFDDEGNDIGGTGVRPVFVNTAELEG
jgi:hypothetical protein